MKGYVSIITAFFLVIGLVGQASITACDPPYWEGEVMLIQDSHITVVAGSDLTPYVISGTSALAALDAAATLGGFNYTVNDEWYDQYGALLVDSIAGYNSDALNGWQYWVNYPHEPLPWDSADKYKLKDGDIIAWYYGGYGSTPDSSSMVIMIQIVIVEDNTPPAVDIIKPSEGGIYFFDREIISIPGMNAVAFGQLTIEALIYDELTEVSLVELYVDDILQFSGSNNSCVWKWEDKTIGLHTIKITGFDQIGNHHSMERIILMVYF